MQSRPRTNNPSLDDAWIPFGWRDRMRGWFRSHERTVDLILLGSFIVCMAIGLLGRVLLIALD